MSAPRIKVRKKRGLSRMFAAFTGKAWVWKCTDPDCLLNDSDYAEYSPGYRSSATLAAAADAGRAHLAAHHTEWFPADEHHPVQRPIAWSEAGLDATYPPQGTYCRTHGTRRDVCGCVVVSVDPGIPSGPHRAAQQLQAAYDTSRSTT